MWLLRRLVVLALASGAAVALAVVALRLLFPLPSLEGRTDSIRVPPDASTRLGAAILPRMAGAPGLSGVAPLADGRDAFAARMLLAREAQRTIDAQYYIWEADATGWMLLDELRAAAERGVRVRLLVDDNGIPGLDRALAGLDALDGAEVRLFNPFTLRSPKALAYLFDFPRLNRRMHNKSFTVDGAVTVVGGRNVGDIYYAYGEGTAYVDLDLLAVGPAALDVSEDFDRYWASGSAYPAALILPPAPEGAEEIARAAEAARGTAATAAYREAVAASPLVRALLDRTLPLEWTRATLLSDDPAKGLGPTGPSGTLLARLLPEIEGAGASLDLLSAYFVPGERGTDLLTGLAARGVAVRVVTNTYASNDVGLVHAGYARWRKPLVAGGVALFELRRETGLPAPPGLTAPGGASGASLHAKTLAMDRARLFVGSFNFDPRSALLNTEMGLLVESPALAAALADHLDAEAGPRAYRVREGADGTLEWVTGESGAEVAVATEPGTTVLSRLGVALLGRLPIEWML